MGLTALALDELLKVQAGKTVVIPPPAAGADFTITVPAGAAWNIISIRAQLVTSAVAGNRLPHMLWTDGANEFARVDAINNQATGLTWVYTWANAFGFAPASGVIQNLPLLPDDAPLQAGYQVKTATAAIDVGDQWSGITVLVREWEPVRMLAQIAWLEQRACMDEFPSGPPAAGEAPRENWAGSELTVPAQTTANSGISISGHKTP